MPQLPNPERDRLYDEFQTQPQLFSSATFSCFLNRSSIRFLSSGEMAVSFLIPATNSDDALSLRYLAANPLPLTVTVEVSQEYMEDLAS